MHAWVVVVVVVDGWEGNHSDPAVDTVPGDTAAALYLDNCWNLSDRHGWATICIVGSNFQGA